MNTGSAIGFFAIVTAGTIVAGMLASWIDRKVTGLVQMRVGPPLLQPLWDLLKLLGKETIVPRGTSRLLFLSAPVAAFAAVAVVSGMVWAALIWQDPAKGFVGDLIVALYLLAVPSLAVVIGGFASRNPLASLGASREMKLMIAYELPFVLAVLVPVIQSNGNIRLGDLAAAPMVLGTISGWIAFIVVILVMQAKLTLIPFDIPEAETEIGGGAFIEYSGPPLGIFRLVKMMMLWVMPFFLITVFWGGITWSGWHILWGVLKYVALLVIIVVVRNTSPRVRIDQALRFFWGPMTGLATLAVFLAFAGW